MIPTDLPLYHSATLTPGKRPLWCLEPACHVATTPFGNGLYRCPKCGKNYPVKDEPVTPETWPEGFPRHAPVKPKRRPRPAAVQQPLGLD